MAPASSARRPSARDGVTAGAPSRTSGHAAAKMMTTEQLTERTDQATNRPGPVERFGLRNQSRRREPQRNRPGSRCWSVQCRGAAARRRTTTRPARDQIYPKVSQCQLRQSEVGFEAPRSGGDTERQRQERNPSLSRNTGCRAAPSDLRDARPPRARRCLRIISRAYAPPFPPSRRRTDAPSAMLSHANAQDAGDDTTASSLSSRPRLISSWRDRAEADVVSFLAGEGRIAGTAPGDREGSGRRAASGLTLESRSVRRWQRPNDPLLSSRRTPRRTDCTSLRTSTAKPRRLVRHQSAVVATCPPRRIDRQSRAARRSRRRRRRRPRRAACPRVLCELLCPSTVTVKRSALAEVGVGESRRPPPRGRARSRSLRA